MTEDAMHAVLTLVSAIVLAAVLMASLAMLAAVMAPTP